MSTTDPGECRGNQTYPPPAPRCVCGHLEGGWTFSLAEEET